MDTKKEILTTLQQDILLWQAFKPQAGSKAERIGLGEIEQIFPGGVFPKMEVSAIVAR